MSLHFQVPQEKIPTLGNRSFLMIGDRSLILFNIAEQFYAINDSCPHQGASLLNGKLEGKVIQCCAHGLRFDLSNGYLLNSTQLQVQSYPVEVIGENVFIGLDCGVALDE
ncbi:Rieske (2Fe-2S) protein [Acinetobacter sp.]|jgi:3-phenylpropionate/trans-cinnamate dioxygenase ferredoxin component|uniref:Rieske (2Fe-2S) protein n=1 Tax=Acinetobacter sp. TaxID=472 RepID=UPI003982284D